VIDAVQAVFLIAALLAGLALIVVLALPEVRLRSARDAAGRQKPATVRGRKERFA
jgi:hypothetical protein